MLHKFKITTCAFILCLFGLTLIGVSNVTAADEEYDNCYAMLKKGDLAKASTCFQKLAKWRGDVISRMESELATLERWVVCVRATGTVQGNYYAEDGKTILGSRRDGMRELGCDFLPEIKE